MVNSIIFSKLFNLISEYLRKSLGNHLEIHKIIVLMKTYMNIPLYNQNFFLACQLYSILYSMGYPICNGYD